MHNSNLLRRLHQLPVQLPGLPNTPAHQSDHQSYQSIHTLLRHAFSFIVGSRAEQAEIGRPAPAILPRWNNS